MPLRAIMRAVTILLVALMFAKGTASAGQTQYQDLAAAAQIELLPGWRANDGQHIAGLKFKLADGWRTYWRLPGDSGIPPHIIARNAMADALVLTQGLNSSLQALPPPRQSRNVTGAELLWTKPDILASYGLTSLGYTDEFVIPINVTVLEHSAPASLNLNVAYGLCKDICFPMVATLSTLLPARTTKNPDIVDALDQVIASAITKNPAAEMACEFHGDSNQQDLAVRFKSVTSPFVGSTVVFDLPGSGITFKMSKVEIHGGTHTASTAFFVADDLMMIERSRLRATVINEHEAFEFTGCS